MKTLRVILFFSASIFLFNGCALWSYNNKELKAKHPSSLERATFEITEPRGNEKVLVLLALSGGGSRAAYFSTSVMFRLQDFFHNIDLLKEVDVISSVSGSSLPAAYYCITKDSEERISVRISGTLEVSSLPAELGSKVIYDSVNKLVSFRGTMSDLEREQLTSVLSNIKKDREKILRLYNYTQAPGRSNKIWEEGKVKKLMSRNFQIRWFGRWFYPTNVPRYWLTAFDRSDIMAQTFSANLFRIFSLKRELRFRDLNPERPYLIINATNATDGEDFGKAYTFTREDFEEELNSDISRYWISNAVMASAAFPGVFNYATLRNYSADDGKKYVHIFDGGNKDNLGLESLKNLKLPLVDRYKSVIVILVDAYVKPKGVDPGSYDARTKNLFSYLIDFNFMKTFDTLMQATRELQIAEIIEFQKSLEERKDLKGRKDLRFEFLHFTFDSISDDGLKAQLNEIPTSFKISKEHTILIDKGVKNLFDVEKKKLDTIKNILLEE